MKKFTTMAALGVALALAGCGGKTEAGKEGGSTASSGPVKREAGLWKTDVKLTKFEMAGMPDSAKDQMSKAMEAASGTEQCITQEQVDKEDIAGDLSKAQPGGGECTWAKKEVGGGKIDVAGSCTANGQKVDLAMNGTIGAKKMDVSMSTKGKAPTGGDMEMVMQITQTHVGPCKS